jgi:hypothetical protein
MAWGLRPIVFGPLASRPDCTCHHVAFAFEQLIFTKHLSGLLVWISSTRSPTAYYAASWIERQYINWYIRCVQAACYRRSKVAVPSLCFVVQAFRNGKGGILD